MSKKKGLCVEEKRSRIMDFYFEKKEFYTLKELEKLCQKEKGITSMSVKDILTSLVEDAMVETDKIGTSVYLRAFPSKASQNRKRKLCNLNEQFESTDKKVEVIESKVKRAKLGKENSDRRTSVLENLAAKQSELSELTREVEKYRECDPEVMEEMKQQTQTAKEAANRWTDNIFSVQSWIKNKFFMEESVLDKQFGIPDDLDYID